MNEEFTTIQLGLLTDVHNVHEDTFMWKFCSYMTTCELLISNKSICNTVL